MKKFYIIGLIIANFMIFGCGGTVNINPTDYKVFVPHKMKIPDACRDEYKHSVPRVSVVQFTNNSTFGKASVTNKDSSKSAEAGIGIVTTSNVTGIGGVVKSDEVSQKTTRDIDSKISKSLASIVESIVLNTGGAELFTREDFEKINDEMKFQDSGLVDEDTLVDFGKIAGVQYIVTGSLDNVEQHYKKGDGAVASTGKLAAQYSNNQNIQILGLIANFAGSALDKPGMTIKSLVTVKILEVSSGRVVFSKTVKGEEFIGQIERPTYDQVIGGIKSAVKKSLDESTKEIGSYFSVRGYITKIRSNGHDLIAQISVGKDKKLSTGQKFIVYTLEENKDPITRATSCDMIDTGVRLEVTNQISSKSAWTVAEDAKVSTIKINQLVQRD